MIDTQSSTWRAIAAWVDAEIASARERNDAPLGLEATASLRGRIETLKDLAQLPARIERDRQAREAAASQYQQPTFMDARDY